MRRWFFNLTVLASLVLNGALVVVWIWSFSLTPLASAPATGLSTIPPAHAIPMPIPADADEYLVPMRGRFQRWEYTPWDAKWYMLAGDVPIWVPTALLLLVPGIWLARRLSPDDPYRVPGSCP